MSGWGDDSRSVRVRGPGAPLRASRTPALLQIFLLITEGIAQFFILNAVKGGLTVIETRCGFRPRVTREWRITRMADDFCWWWAFNKSVCGRRISFWGYHLHGEGQHRGEILPLPWEKEK